MFVMRKCEGKSVIWHLLFQGLEAIIVEVGVQGFRNIWINGISAYVYMKIRVSFHFWNYLLLTLCKISVHFDYIKAALSALKFRILAIIDNSYINHISCPEKNFIQKILASLFYRIWILILILRIIMN